MIKSMMKSVGIINIQRFISGTQTIWVWHLLNVKLNGPFNPMLT